MQRMLWSPVLKNCHCSSEAESPKLIGVVQVKILLKIHEVFRPKTENTDLRIQQCTVHGIKFWYL
jgi:hypothetical protein